VRNKGRPREYQDAPNMDLTDVKNLAGIQNKCNECKKVPYL
jgi:hypothetical protein